MATSPVKVHLGSTVVAGKVLVQTGSITGPGVLVQEGSISNSGVLVEETGSGAGVYVQFDAPSAPQRITSDGSIRVTSDGSIRITSG